METFAYFKSLNLTVEKNKRLSWNLTKTTENFIKSPEQLDDDVLLWNISVFNLPVTV